MTGKVALITCMNLPEPDPDQQLLLDTLAGAGVRAELLAWDDPTADPATFDLCILRSCWNYYHLPDAFMAWCDRTASVSRLLNSIEVIRWNIHKRYLAELERAGVPVIPSVWINRNQAANLTDTMKLKGWNDVVIKPAISAGSFNTRRFKRAQSGEGQTFLSDLLNKCDVLVQRYMPSVETEGERCLVWIDGQFTHAVRKNPRFADGIEQVSDALSITEQQRAFAAQALASVQSDLLYGRVDVITDDAGQMMISEIELTEPSLFFLQCPAALHRFVAAIKRLHASRTKEQSCAS